MNDRPWLEARIGQLISDYADQAPIDADPVAVARSVGGGRVAKRRIRFELWSNEYGLVLGLLIVAALLVAIMTGVAAAGSHLFRRPLADAPEPIVVAPFVGFAPKGADPSGPASGDLVMSFDGRRAGSGLYRAWLYGDGRLVWMSESGNDGQVPAGAVVEQRLTSYGVALLRSLVTSEGHVVGPAVEGPDGAAGPGVVWGALTLAQDGQLFDVAWVDDDVVKRLADPLAWLPPSAWDDPVMHGFVPSRYAVCAWLDDIPADPAGEPGMAALEAGDHLMRVDAPNCRVVTIDDARAIVAALPADAMESGVGPRFNLTVASDVRLTIDIVPVVPSGDVVCNCG